MMGQAAAADIKVLPVDPEPAVFTSADRAPLTTDSDYGVSVLHTSVLATACAVQAAQPATDDLLSAVSLTLIP